jgi:hypothetical protein
MLNSASTIYPYGIDLMETDFLRRVFERALATDRMSCPCALYFDAEDQTQGIQRTADNVLISLFIVAGNS